MKNEEILKNIDFGSKDPIQTIERRIYYLYKITNKLNNMIYLGSRVCYRANPYKDPYMGCGICINKKGETVYNYNNPTSPYFNAVKDTGIDNFRKEILMFFASKEDLHKAEKLVVNEELIKRNDTYNKTIGGGAPPRNSGKDNGNFENYWNEEQKHSLSALKRELQQSVGAGNPRATPCYLYDFLTDTKYALSHIREIPSFIGRSLDYNWNSLMSFRYLLLRDSEEPYEKAATLKRIQLTMKVIIGFKEGKSIEEIIENINASGHQITVIKKFYKNLINESIRG